VTVRPLGIVKGYNKQSIEYLTEILDRAKAGEIVEVMCVVKLKGGMFEHAYTGCSDLHELVGVLERAKHLTLRRMDTL